MPESKTTKTRMAIGLAICICALACAVVVMGRSGTRLQRNDFIFSGIVTSQDGVKESGVFEHNWKSDTNTLLFSTEHKNVDMSYSPDKSRILALDEERNVLELDMATHEVSEVLSHEALKELVVNELAASDTLSSEALDTHELVISHAYYYEDGFIIDDGGALYSVKPQNDTWAIARFEGVPHFSEFFLMGAAGAEEVLLKTSNYDHSKRDFGAQKVEFFVYDLKSNSCEKLLETRGLTGYPFGDNYMTCINANRDAFAYIDFSCSDYADVSVYSLEANGVVKTMTHIEELGTKATTERYLSYLLDSEEVLGRVAESGFSGREIVISGETVGKTENVDVEAIYCAI